MRGFVVVWKLENFGPDVAWLRKDLDDSIEQLANGANSREVIIQ